MRWVDGALDVHGRIGLVHVSEASLWLGEIGRPLRERLIIDFPSTPATREAAETYLLALPFPTAAPQPHFRVLGLPEEFGGRPWKAVELVRHVPGSECPAHDYSAPTFGIVLEREVPR